MACAMGKEPAEKNGAWWEEVTVIAGESVAGCKSRIDLWRDCVVTVLLERDLFFRNWGLLLLPALISE